MGSCPDTDIDPWLLWKVKKKMLNKFNCTWNFYSSTSLGEEILQSSLVIHVWWLLPEICIKTILQ